jgi:hypothetical protein
MLELVAVLALAAVIPSRADSHAKDDRARFELRIPFEFVVGNRVMPPGLYRVEQLLGSPELDILSVRCLETGAYQAITTAVITTVDPQVASRLTFHRYGNRFFLAGLWVRGKRAGLQLHTSVTENQAAQAQLAREEISLTLNNEAVVASAKPASNH